MKGRLALSLLLVSLVLPATGRAAYGPASATVYESNFRFCDLPVCLPTDVSSTTIDAGGHLTFTYADAACTAFLALDCYHNVVSATGAFHSTAPQPTAGPQVTVYFDTPGDYLYVCGKHGPGMHGIVHVRAL